jgi:hypothetical protein
MSARRTFFAATLFAAGFCYTTAQPGGSTPGAGSSPSPGGQTPAAAGTSTSPSPGGQTPTASAPTRVSTSPTPTASAPTQVSTSPTPAASAPAQVTTSPTPRAAAPIAGEQATAPTAGQVTAQPGVSATAPDVAATPGDSPADAADAASDEGQQTQDLATTEGPLQPGELRTTRTTSGGTMATTTGGGAQVPEGRSPIEPPATAHPGISSAEEIFAAAGLAPAATADAVTPPANPSGLGDGLPGAGASPDMIAGAPTADAWTTAGLPQRQTALNQIEAQLHHAQQVTTALPALPVDAPAAVVSAHASALQDVRASESELRASLQNARAAGDDQWPEARNRLAAAYENYRASLARVQSIRQEVPPTGVAE